MAAALVNWVWRWGLTTASGHVVWLWGAVLRPAGGKVELISSRTLHDDGLVTYRHRTNSTLVLGGSSSIPIRPGSLGDWRDAGHQVIHVSRVTLCGWVVVPGRRRSHCATIWWRGHAAHLRWQWRVDSLAVGRVSLREGRRRPRTVRTIHNSIYHHWSMSRSQRLFRAFPARSPQYRLLHKGSTCRQKKYN